MWAGISHLSLPQLCVISKSETFLFSQSSCPPPHKVIQMQMLVCLVFLVWVMEEEERPIQTARVNGIWREEWKETEPFHEHLLIYKCFQVVYNVLLRIIYVVGQTGT